MSDVLFVAKIGSDELRIEVANRFDRPFTLDCNLDRRGSPVYLELPRRYQMDRSAAAFDLCEAAQALREKGHE
ncbi:hypothetical protein DENIT_20129 [Pseudomonas veronii]|uniref:hypothetical protein n=1 Tax=Pseudomonas veronii TaxID=76761 RepID=UPI00175CC02B|nr:hypothetical protein [Pseudomonas veronii]CAD0264240.1 hypothetical protein DENIT_20129 [Pseudomonas veronii]